jgi:hypothetical protein
MLSLLIVDASVNAEDQDEKLNYLVVGSGFEYLSYTEHEPETGSYTDISLCNVVTRFEGSMSLSPFVIGIKGILPFYLDKEKEEWMRSGSIYQTNNLEYSRTRIDGNVGYRLYHWLYPYLGLRWSKSKQKRNDFILSEPVSGKAIETNNALFAAAGIKGILLNSARWEFGYSLDCFLPVYAHTENSALQGWESPDKDGYSIGARAVARYIYSPSVSFDFELAGERVKWDGSGWIDYPGGSAKWPKNKTLSLNFILGIAWFF